MRQRPDHRYGGRILRGRSKDAAEHAGSGARWFRYENVKVEAAIFLLIVVTFAALLGKSAITSQKLVLSPAGGQFVGYAFADSAGTGGRSTIAVDPLRRLSWTCRIRDGVAYPYCGYGMQLSVVAGDGLNFSHFKTITLRFSYRGAADRAKLVVKTSPPPGLRARVADENMPLAMEFPVVNGRNEIRLPMSQLGAEQWWVASHGLSTREAAPDFDNVQAVEISTSGARAPSELGMSVDEIAFEGAYLSTEQWYLVILGVWLVLTGAFLVHRFFRMRRDYEARQQRQAQEARLLASAHAAAEAASNAKSEFLGNMSHELRTPLNAIIGYAYWLARTELGPKQLEAVKTIQASGEHLSAVITDILDIAKIEAGKLELLPASFDLHHCVAGVGQMFQLRAEEKGLGFVVGIAPDVPRLIVADQKRVRQVLINLLGNAVKFTPAGQVALRVCVALRTDGAAKLRFVVEDTGIGIPVDQADSIFRPFEQAGSALDRSGGTGLGLSITRQIVEMMQGEVRVESVLGQGSRFTIDVAFPVADQAKSVLEAPAAAQISVSGGL